MKDTVIHPDHYGAGKQKHEAWDAIHEWGLNFDFGNTVKYLVRAGKKDGVDRFEDLHKALNYLKHGIECAERDAGIKYDTQETGTERGAAHWIDNGVCSIRCDNCDMCVCTPRRFDFCPNCGCKMIKEDE